MGSTSRISTAQIFSSGQSHISTAREKEMANTEKASSLKQLTRPSEDPPGWVMSKNMRDSVTVGEAIAKNASVAQNTLTATEDLLKNVQETLQKTHELALAAAGTADETARAAVLSDVQSLYATTLQTLNTRYGGRTLLAGFRGEAPAFDATGQYVGDGGTIEIEVAPGLKVPLSISAEQSILGQGRQNGVNIPRIFETLIEGLNNNDTAMVEESLDGFFRGIDQLSLARSQIGAVMNEIDRSLTAHANERTNRLEHVSKIEDADAVKVFSELARDQTVLRSAIATTQKILSENPTDILFK